MVVERVIDEYLEHAGQNNGRLIVPYIDFQEYGISNHTIPEGIEIAEALGFLVVHRGRKSAKDHRNPSRYGLTFYPIAEEFETNDWNRIKSTAQAEAIVERVKAEREARLDAEKAKRELEKSRNKVVAPSLVPAQEEGEDVAVETPLRKRA
jgi:hypothetical protein